VDIAGLELLGEIGGLDLSKLSAKYQDRTFQVWEINQFTNYDGLLADPTRLLRNVVDWPPAEKLNVDGIIRRLQDKFLVIEDEAAYRARFAPKTSLLDRDHFGNFHQQLGCELMVMHREFAENWWLKQKYSEDYSRVLNNLYGAVQANYLEGYFRRQFTKGASVIDLGCGIGFYSNMIAQAGAKVLGVDPNPKYIDIARSKSAPGVRFEVLNVGVKGALDAIPSASADFVFMSDALLFYFVPDRPTQVADVQILLADIRRILKAGGTFISMEPHYIFWLLPWWGEIEHPFTILTEYRNKNFGVTATISKLIQTFAKGGFVVTWMDEIPPRDDFKDIDARAYYFAREFPMWQIFELKSV
jgi:SAM-dependent methyltransferase